MERKSSKSIIKYYRKCTFLEMTVFLILIDTQARSKYQHAQNINMLKISTCSNINMLKIINFKVQTAIMAFAHVPALLVASLRLATRPSSRLVFWQIQCNPDFADRLVGKITGNRDGAVLAEDALACKTMLLNYADVLAVNWHVKLII
jgi:hypothetical protein